mmetsp:Transcript_25634/g.59538  ORF Transcript_25634/g.59538 Transcript_25634/m.59538 type:complete len:363 (+) Transcript_25634:61-1149(+)
MKFAVFALVAALRAADAAKSTGHLRASLSSDAAAPQQALLSLVAAAANAKGDSHEFDISSLASLAASIQKTGGVGDTVNTIKGLVTGMIESLSQEAAAAQSGLANRTLFDTCNANKATALGDVAKLEAAAPKDGHYAEYEKCQNELTVLNATASSCGDQEDLLRVAKEARCEYFGAVDRSNNFQSWFCHEDDFPASSSYEAYLQRNIDMLAEYRKRKQNCSDAESNYTTKRTECSAKSSPVATKELHCATLKANATEAICVPYQGKVSACNAYDSCWASSAAAAANSFDTAVSISENLKTQWEALKRIECLLDVLTKDGDQTAALTECVKKTHTTDSLTIVKPQLPTKEACEPGVKPEGCVV